MARQGQGKAGGDQRPTGPNSYRADHARRVFQGLGLKTGQQLLDLGCGPGDWSLAAADIVGSTGWVFALDIWKTMVAGLTAEARARGLGHVRAVVADITAGLPFPDRCMDACFMSTVLHMPRVTPHIPAIAAEMRRVLKRGGRLALIEGLNPEAARGLPIDPRLTLAGIERQMTGAGFGCISRVDLGYHYLFHFD